MIDKDYCYGCSACYSICPQSCIEMVPDEEGFFYPQINKDKCISCGKCEAVCPAAVIRKDFSQDPFTWGGHTKDSYVRRSSSSGGVFTELAKSVISKSGVVFGAAFNDTMDGVQHIAVDNISDIQLLQGSKYVQSNIGDCYSLARKYLEDGRWVLFSGTFCQIDGLVHFLDNDYPKLVLVETICHGIPSPKLLCKYLMEIKKKLKGELQRVSFRDEEGGETLYISVETDHGKYRCSSQSDPFYNLFYSNNCLRPSCYNCRSKGKERLSDITIADFWGVEDVAPDLADGKSISLVIVNTNKGMNLFNEIKDDLVGRQVDFKNAISANRAFFVPYQKPATRDRFWIDFPKMTTSQLRLKYCHVVRKRIKKLLKPILRKG